jgi:hypothetical protein
MHALSYYTILGHLLLAPTSSQPATQADNQPTPHTHCTQHASSCHHKTSPLRSRNGKGWNRRGARDRDWPERVGSGGDGRSERPGGKSRDTKRLECSKRKARDRRSRGSGEGTRDGWGAGDSKSCDSPAGYARDRGDGGDCKPRDSSAGVLVDARNCWRGGGEVGGEQVRKNL